MSKSRLKIFEMIKENMDHNKVSKMGNITQNKIKEEGVIKMDKEYISKFEDDKVEVLKSLLDEMKSVEEIDIDKFKEFIVKIEGVITVPEIIQNTEDKSEPVVDKKPAETETPAETKVDDTTKTPAETTEPEDKPPVEPVVEPTEPVDETSKQGEIEAYKSITAETISKFKELNETYKTQVSKCKELEVENATLKEKLSKFETEKHSDLVNEVVQEMSKFRNIPVEQLSNKKEELSKMSESALNIMKAEFSDINLSKMSEEEDAVTKHSQELNNDYEKEHVSKMKDSAINRLFNSKFNIKN